MRVLVGMLFLIPVLMLGQSMKLAPELKQVPSTQMVSVIVQYKSDAFAGQAKELVGGLVPERRN